MKENNIPKKIAIAVMASLASVSVLLGGVFDSSKDLLQEYPKDDETIIHTSEDYAKDQLQKAQQKDGIRNKVRKMLFSIPVKVRAVLFAPLWAMGSAILWAADLLFKTMIAPIGHLILGFVLQTLLMFGIIGVCIKILFPDLPWSKIFSKKLFLSVLFGSIFMSLCDYIVPHFWEDYTIYRRISKLIIGMIIVFIILRPFIRKKLKNRISYQIEYNDQVLG